MGLDMYLEKINRNAVGFMHVDLDEAKANNMEFYNLVKPYIIQKGSKSYSWDSVREEVGYWRKANQIHSWFVENVQDGEDDCGSYEVSVKQLNKLLDICKYIKSKCILVDGKVHNGTTYYSGKTVENYEDGKIISNKFIAEEFLPTQSGFFFGGTDYDQYYMVDIDNTIEIIEKVLKETNFNTHAIYYSSSW